MRTLLLTLTTCLFVLPVYAQYSGGSGTAQDPYQIATVADLIALGETPAAPIQSAALERFTKRAITPATAVIEHPRIKNLMHPSSSNSRGTPPRPAQRHPE